MKEGEPGDEFCILAEGEVKVTKRGRLLSVLGAGEPFGEMAYLSKNDKRRGADVTVSAEADIIYIPTAKLARVSERLPAQLRSRLHGDPRRAPRQSQPAAFRRIG